MDKLSEHAIRMLEIARREGVCNSDVDAIAEAIYDTILQVQMLKMVDRKTEPSGSEKPNNCETCLYRDCPWDAPICDSCTMANSHYERDEFDKDTNVRSKDCETCKHYNPDHEAIACERCLGGKYSRYEPKTEPQTCSNCKFDHEEWFEEACDSCCDAHSNWQPKTEPQTERSSE